MTVGIRASVATSGINLEDTMTSSQIEGIVEQVRGRDVDPVAPKGRGKKDKSRDLIASLEGRVTRLEVAMADTKEGVDLMEQSMEKAVEDLKVQIQDLKEGMQGSPVPVVSHEEFMKVIDMLSSLESRVGVLTKHEEELRQEVTIYNTTLSSWVMATHEAPRVECQSHTPLVDNGMPRSWTTTCGTWRGTLKQLGSMMRQPRYELLLFTSSIMQLYGGVESSWRWKGRRALYTHGRTSRERSRTSSTKRMWNTWRERKLCISSTRGLSVTMSRNSLP